MASRAMPCCRVSHAACRPAPSTVDRDEHENVVPAKRGGFQSYCTAYVTAGGEQMSLIRSNSIPVNATESVFVDSVFKVARPWRGVAVHVHIPQPNMLECREDE